MSFRLLVISGVFPPIKAPESAHTLTFASTSPAVTWTFTC